MYILYICPSCVIFVNISVHKTKQKTLCHILLIILLPLVNGSHLESPINLTSMFLVCELDNLKEFSMVFHVMTEITTTTHFCPYIEFDNHLINSGSENGTRQQGRHATLTYI